MLGQAERYFQQKPLQFGAIVSALTGSRLRLRRRIRRRRAGRQGRKIAGGVLIPIERQARGLFGLLSEPRAWRGLCSLASEASYYMGFAAHHTAALQE